MAHTPRHVDIEVVDGIPVRVNVTFVRPFKQTVRVQFCWLYEAGIDHACDEMGCQ